VRVNLSQLREHAELVADGLTELEREAKMRWAMEHG
jgi:hypothetical protein